MELKEFYKLGCDIYEVPKASDPLDKIHKPVRTVKNKQVMLIHSNGNDNDIYKNDFQ